MARYFKPVLLSLAFALLVGCRKLDLKFRDPAKHCRVQMMTGLLGEQVIHRSFTYDEFGNPVLAKYVETDDGTGTPNFNFYYNDKHQLISYTGYSSHRLSYNSSGQVMIDSAQYYYTGGDSRYEDRYYYDWYGRISKVVSKFYYDVHEAEEVGTVTTVYYMYDRRGNLIRPGVTYDNKTNLSRTHPVWMFINKDYSLNNAVKATSYNAAGLPLTFDEFTTFLQSSIFVHTVEYDCGSGKN
jgi:hypothetical protein